ncbi:MAG: hypothetical protein HC926_05665 [Synechococcaceae cyanobacterium SM2_3_60]|nr:hypothetical protein [Synechococcaceae cyanobacterium SM2_3_60]
MLAPLNSFFRDGLRPAFGHRDQAGAQTAALTEFMQAQAGQPSVTVLVTHFVNIIAIAGVNI